MVSETGSEDAGGLSLEDLTSCGWEQVVSGVLHHKYGLIAVELLSASIEAGGEKQSKRKRALDLLGRICLLELESDNDRPLKILPGTEEFTPKNLTTDEIALLEQFLHHVNEPKLRGRIADVLWLGKPEPDYRHALTAIEAYKSVPLTADTWVLDALYCWERAAILSQSLGQTAATQLSELRQGLLDRLYSATIQDQFYSLRIAEVLKAAGLDTEEEAGSVAGKLSDLADAFRLSGDFYAARHHFAGAAFWHRNAGNEQAWVEATISSAEACASEASEALSLDSPNYVAATHSYQDSVRAYQLIPRATRTQYQLDGRIREIRGCLESCVKYLSASRASADVLPTGASRTKEDFLASVKGRTQSDVLRTFVGFERPRKRQMREAAIDSLRSDPLRTLRPYTMLSRDGRIVARELQFFGDTGHTADEMVIQAEMIGSHYCTYVVDTALNLILPALDIIRSEHRFTEGDFVRLAQDSLLVPPNREKLFGRALYAGYVRDFVASIHLLSPQVEHTVRYLLQLKGVVTTTLSEDGAHNEKGLNALMEAPEVVDVLGEDMAFEIDALFCSQFGGNLRNSIAHGLLDDRECESADFVYAWWLGLRLVVNVFGVPNDS